MQWAAADKDERKHGAESHQITTFKGASETNRKCSTSFARQTPATGLAPGILIFFARDLWQADPFSAKKQTHTGVPAGTSDSGDRPGLSASQKR